VANVGTLMVTIDGNTYKLQRELKKAERQLKRFSGRATKSFTAVGAVVRKVRGIVAIFGAAVGVTIGLATRQFVKFEDALLDLQKVMLDSEGSAKQFIGITKEISNTFGEAASEVLQGAANFKQAGFTVQEAFKLQEVAMKGATASQLSVVDASQKLTRILKGFKAPASEAQRAFNLINAVSNKFATSFGELATGMAQFSPIAKLMGFTMEETAAVLTPIIEVFGSGSEAAVAMRTSMLRLTSTQTRTRDTLKALLIDQKNLDGTFKSGRDILFEVMKAYQLLDDNQKIFVAQQLTGIRQAGRAVEVFNGLTKVLNVHGVALKDVGSIDKEVEVRLKSLGKQLGRAKQAFVNMGIDIGGFFAPAITKATRLVIGFLKSFKTGGDLEIFTKVLKEIANIFLQLAADLTTIARVVKNTIGKVGRSLGNRGLKFDPKALGDREKFGGEEGRPNQISSIPLINKLIAERGTGLGGMSEEAKQIKKNIEDLFNAADETAKELEETFKSFNLEKMALTKSASRVAIAQFEKEAEAYNILVAEGKIGAEELRDFKIDSISKIKLQHNRAYQTMQSSIMSWGDEFGNTLTDMVMGAEVSFSDILNSFTRMIADMAVKITIIQPMMQALFGQAAGGSGSGWVGQIAGALGTAVGGWIGGGASFNSLNAEISSSAVGTQLEIANSPALSGLDLGWGGLPSGTNVYKAEGGIATKPTAGIFGEAGPEALIPLDRMSQVMGSIGGGGSNVEINIIGAPEGTRVEESESEQGGRSIDVILDEKMSQQVKPGSKFNNQMLSQFRDMQQSTIRR